MKIYLFCFLLLLTALGCKKNNEDENKDHPKADFTYYDQTYTLNDSILLYNHSEFSTKFKWIFDNEATSDQYEPKYLFKTPGIKKIKLICSDDAGRKDSLTREITILDEKYINIPEDSHIRVNPVAMKIIGNAIYVVSSKYNTNYGYSLAGVIEKYDLNFNKIWEKRLGSTYPNPPKGDIIVTSGNQLLVLIRGCSNALYQYIYLLDLDGNIINKQELFHYYINGVIEQEDKFVFSGNYVTNMSIPLILKTDKSLNKIGSVSYNIFGSYANFLDINNNGTPVILGQKQSSYASSTSAPGNYFLFFLDNNLDSLSFQEIPVNYNFMFDNFAKLRKYNNRFFIYDFKTLFSFNVDNKTLSSKEVGDGYIRAFELFENQFVLFAKEKAFIYDLGFSLLQEKSNNAFRYYTDYFNDVEKLADNKYLMLGSYDDHTTLGGYAEHLRFFIFKKE
jgi:PKD repeat protein